MSKLLPDVSLHRLAFSPNYARLQRSRIAASGKGGAGGNRREGKGKADIRVRVKEKCSGVKLGGKKAEVDKRSSRRRRKFNARGRGSGKEGKRRGVKNREGRMEGWRGEAWQAV